MHQSHTDFMGEFTIAMTQGSIGPAHDPYGTETIEVTRGNKSAEWYSDGLGQDRVRLYDKADGKDILVREINWSSTKDDRESRMTTFKCRLLFKQWVGIASDSAEELFNNSYEPDPMGHPSRYE